MNDDALLADATAYLHGQADTAAVRRLETRLVSDPAFRTSFVAMARLHGHLREIGNRAAQGVIDSARLLAVHPAHQVPTARTVRRRRRLWLGWTAAAAALLAIGLGILSIGIIGLRTKPMIPTVTEGSGGLIIASDGSERPAEVGVRLRVGDQVTTAPGSAGLTVSLHGGRFVLGPGSAVTVAPGEVRRRYLRLDAGWVEADLSATDTPLAILVGDTTVQVADARTIVRLEPGLARIVVARGAVAVAQPGTPERVVPHGATLEAQMTTRPAGASL